MRALRLCLALSTLVMAACDGAKTLETWADVGEPVAVVVEGGTAKTGVYCQEMRVTTNRDDKERRAVQLRFELPDGSSPPAIEGLTEAKPNVTVKVRTADGTFTGAASLAPKATAGHFPVQIDPLPTTRDSALFITPGLKECSVIVRR